MKVLLINGSPHKNGNTALALAEMEKVFEAEGVDCEIIHIGNQPICGCIACGSCAKTGKCVFDDAVNETAEKFAAADGLVLASPVYYAGPNATLTAFADRLFCSASFDRLNKYFTICGMPVASSQYWNSAHGRAPGEAAKDAEGMQTMRALAHNMSFLMKSIALGKEAFGLPEKEPWQPTHFIR